MDQLTSYQQAAVNFNDGLAHVIAGAGSGKTKVLMHRAKRLIEEGKAKDDEILMITFTNKAADEQRERLSLLLGRNHGVHIETFHSHCLNAIKQLYPKEALKVMKIIMPNETLEILSRIIKQLGLPVVNADVAQTITSIKNKIPYKLSSYKEYLMHIRIYIEYQAYLQDHTVMDFDEMLFQYNNEMLLNDEFLEMESSQYKYVMVDECQDMNPIQMLIVELIITKHRNAMYVGDTDQAIYGWRGSDSNLIMNLVRKKKMKVFTLPDNFRSDGTIVFAAERLISHNQNRMDKCMVPVKPMVNPIIKDTYIDKKSEAIGIASKIEKHHKEGMPYKDMMVLYRNNIDSTMIEMILEEKGIPYEIDGTSLISRKEIALCISYYSFLWNTKDDMAFLEILNNPARGIGPARLNDITNASSAHHCSMYEACKYVKDSHITKFVEMIESLLILKDSLSIPDFFDYMVKHTGIYQAMERESQSYRRFMRMNAFKEALVSYMESNDSIMDFINNFKLSNLKEETNEDRVRLLTIHQAKGLEAKVVFIAGCNLETMPGNKTSLKEIEEERNLMYVAVTRAMDYLYITVPLKNLQNQPLHPSPFIKELLTLPKIKVEDDPELPF